MRTGRDSPFDRVRKSSRDQSDAQEQPWGVFRPTIFWPGKDCEPAVNFQRILRVQAAGSGITIDP